MKLGFSTRVTLSVLFASRLASAFVSFSPATQTPSAAYFMNNDPAGNYLFTASIQSTGQMTLVAAYPTGGTGAHAITITPDALFSQGCVSVCKAANLVAAVNAGSNTISLFSISSKAPSALTQVGSPVASGGDFPISVGFNSACNTLCTVNTGKINNVSCFTVSIGGGLVPLAGTTRSLGLNQTNPPSGPAFTASFVRFTPDDSQVLAIVKGSTTTLGGTQNAPGFMAVWAVNQDGSLSSLFESIPGGALPWSATLVPGTSGYISADGGFGYDIYNLATPLTAALEYSVPGAGVICWTEYSAKTGNFYLSDFITATIDEVSVDTSLKGTFVNSYSTGQYAGNMDIRVSSLPNQPDRLYVLAANTSSIVAFTLNGPGSASLIQTLDVGTPAAAAKVPFQPTYVYGMDVWA
ncbi:hypothetical protein AX17_002396 [Amanita inopinata Kibby_2008]|nr:hypothetical protein AX17_002396 [Amanita inopinata Kibby_2008]